MKKQLRLKTGSTNFFSKIQERKSDVILKLLGLLLLIAAILKGWQLLTVPNVKNDLWSHRLFFILAVEVELSLGIWLLSGVFKKAAWIATVSCFSLFSIITLYKGLSGAESCGCFGSIHVNPRVTLFAIDLPALIALAIFRPKNKRLFEPFPQRARLVTIGCLKFAIFIITIAILVFNKPAKTTSSYEVLGPETWVRKKLPILEHIDIGTQLKESNWIALFYHHDCQDCIEAITKCEQMSQELTGNGNILQVAIIEVPPYDQKFTNRNSPCLFGCISDDKKWFISTPLIVLLQKGMVVAVWDKQIPSFNEIFEHMNFNTFEAI